MPAFQRIVALDVGSHSVKMGEFLFPKPGFLTLSKFAVMPLGLDPNKDEDRQKVLTSTIRSLLDSTGIKPHARSAFSVGGHAVFMRSVKLPAVDATQVEQMIAFEAQQIVPFPLNEVVWDFQVFPEKSGSVEKEAIIVAMKSDLLEAESSAVEAAGVQNEIIDVGPLALYNAYRYNYLPSEGCTLLIDFGARSTNLLFIENQRFYARFLPLAGNTVSQTICNEFQEPFHVAEQLKLERGGVNLGGDYASPEDRDTARLWKIIRTVMNRLHTEINRSIIFYRNQQGGTYPVEILITGGTSRTPYIENFLSERFGVPVNRFNPFQNVSFAPSVDARTLSPVASGFGEVVGLALRAVGDCPVEVSLVPPSVAGRRETNSGRPLVYGALAACLLVAAVLVGNAFWQLHLVNREMDKISQQTAQLQGLATQQKPLEKQYADLRQKYDLAEKLFQQRSAWVDLLRDLNSKIPQGLWITVLNPTYGGQSLDVPVTESKGKAARPAAPGAKPAAEEMASAPEINQLQVRGLFEKGIQGAVIDEFVRSLADLDYFDIDMQKVAQSVISTESLSPENSEQLAGKFELRLKLKKPISLRP